MEYIDFSGQAGFQDPAEDGGAERNAQPLQHFSQAASSYLQDQTKFGYLNPNVQHNCDIKPRLTKEQHDILEAHFQKQHKPSTNTKKSFAESLNVSLDKVNNWFQNRRAKSKQESKKQAGSNQNIHNAYQAASSDTEVSPGFVSPTSEYYSLMKQWSAEEQPPNGLGISQTQPSQKPLHGIPYINNNASNAEQYTDFLMPQPVNQGAFDSQIELNRRTLTQEQFDAMDAIVRNGGLVNGSGAYEDFQTDLSGDHGALNQAYSEIQGDLKQQEVFAFPHPVGAPLSSDDSSLPSNVSEISLSTYPSSSNMHGHPSMSGTSSDWADSRRSSIHDGALAQMLAFQQQPVTTTSQWQPGQSVPVDFNALQEQFRMIDQARLSPQEPHTHEQPLAWPADEAFVRRDSSTALLAQSMSNVGIQTPQPAQSATFKSPAPPSSLAARRQRPRPAALGIPSLRSQSYSGAVTSLSPKQVQYQQPSVNPEQQLRRIKSSNVLGSVAPGRVMKSVPGSAQRSPLTWSTADALNSPDAVRHMSASTQGNLAPPTPMSPREFAKPEQPSQFQPWHAVPGNAARHASISETDLHRGLPYQSSVPAQNFSSPPHTPMYYQQHFIPQRVAGTFIPENTPPQSAPASQSCFSSNIFGMPHYPQPQAPGRQQVQAMPMSQHQQFMSTPVAEQQFLGSNFAFTPNQQANIPTSGPPPGIPLQFTNGTPVVNADGSVEMAFPAPQMQFNQPSQWHSSPQMMYPYGSSAGVSGSLQGNATPPKPASDFFVHEYNPPESVKSDSTPPRSVDTGPKNYTFSNAGPQHFGDKKQKKSEKESCAASCSPASSTGTLSS